LTSIVLLDPGVVLGAVSDRGLRRLQEWADDTRVRLGERTWNQLADFYNGGAPGLPQELVRISHRTFGDLLTRDPVLHHAVSDATTLSETYLGQVEHGEMIAADLRGAHEARLEAALGTNQDFWDGTPATISCVPPPPDNITIHLEPNLPTAEEVRASYVEWFSGRRILIVGGQIDEHVKGLIEVDLGVPVEAVRWIPSEKNKRARNLKSVIRGLPSNAIVVCVVGKVGHDVSGEVKDYAEDRSLVHVASRYSSQIVDDLKDLAG
jgi:hypothetical protein